MYKKMVAEHNEFGPQFNMAMPWMHFASRSAFIALTLVSTTTIQSVRAQRLH